MVRRHIYIESPPPPPPPWCPFQYLFTSYQSYQCTNYHYKSCKNPRQLEMVARRPQQICHKTIRKRSTKTRDFLLWFGSVDSSNPMFWIIFHFYFTINLQSTATWVWHDLSHIPIGIKKCRSVGIIVLYLPNETSIIGKTPASYWIRARGHWPILLSDERTAVGQWIYFCPACRTTLIATRFRVAVICPIIQVPHCIRVFFYFVWFVFINHIFQSYYELCTYCNILDIYLS